jgi:hypothetical protein
MPRRTVFRCHIAVALDGRIARPGGAPPGVVARGGDIAAIAAEIEAAGHGRVWVEGAGLPLVPDGTPETGCTLRAFTPRTGGALHLLYERA